MTKYYGITPDDIDGLPAELVDQLNIPKSLKESWRIINIIKSLGGVGQLDKILIEYYKKYEIVLDRSKLAARLYRMSVKGLIETDLNKKGVYTTVGLSKNKEQ